MTDKIIEGSSHDVGILLGNLGLYDCKGHIKDKGHLSINYKHLFK